MAPHVAHPGPSDPHGRVTAACHPSMLLRNTNVRHLLATYAAKSAAAASEAGARPTERVAKQTPRLAIIRIAA